MTLDDLKLFVESRLTKTEIKAFGFDLRRRDSWETLADRCQEYAAAAMGIATKATQTGYAVLLPCLWGILWLCCLTFHAGQALAQWWRSAPTKASDSAAAILVRHQDSRLSSTVMIGGAQ
jgi:hypothetical protein